MMYLIPACLHRPFFPFRPCDPGPCPGPTLLVLTLTLPWLLKRIGRARAKARAGWTVITSPVPAPCLVQTMVLVFINRLVPCAAPSALPLLDF